MATQIKRSVLREDEALITAAEPEPAPRPAPDEPPAAVRVGLLDDHPIVRVATRRLIETELRWQVVAEWGDARSFLDQAAACPLDVLLLDLAIGREDGLALLAASGCRADRIVVITMHDTPLHRSRALKAGVAAYVTKQDPLDLLVETLRRIDPSQHADTPRGVEGPAGWGRHGKDLLTAREMDVLALILDGRSVTQIADQLAVSIKTVYVHRENLMRKLGASRPAEIASRAQALQLR